MLLPGSLAPSQPLGFMAPIKPNALCSLASYITNYNPNPIKERVLCIMITYGSPFAFIACQGCGYSSSPPRRYAIRTAGAAEQGSVLQRRQSLGRRVSRVGGTQQQGGVCTRGIRRWELHWHGQGASHALYICPATKWSSKAPGLRFGSGLEGTGLLCHVLEGVAARKYF